MIKIHSIDPETATAPLTRSLQILFSGPVKGKVIQKTSTSIEITYIHVPKDGKKNMVPPEKINNIIQDIKAHIWNYFPAVNYEIHYE